MFGYMTELDTVEIKEKHEIIASADDLDGNFGKKCLNYFYL